MAIKSFKPYSPGRRFMTVSSFEELTTDKPEKSLVTRLKKHGGRNNQGRLSVRHKGGGHKRLYRIIDFKRNTARNATSSRRTASRSACRLSLARRLT